MSQSATAAPAPATGFHARAGSQGSSRMTPTRQRLPSPAAVAAGHHPQQQQQQRRSGSASYCPLDRSPTRIRTSSVSSSSGGGSSWAQQQQPLLHIHLTFLVLIIASLWTYCMSRSDLLSHSLFRISAPNTHLLSHLYQQQESQVKSSHATYAGAAEAASHSVVGGGSSAAAAVPSTDVLSTASLIGGGGQSPASAQRHSFSWSSSPYPVGTSFPPSACEPCFA